MEPVKRHKQHVADLTMGLVGVVCLFGLFAGTSVYAQDDILDFFAEEAKVVQTVTASRLPLSVRQSPATIHVVTGEDIRAMGAQTLWDALRGVPGVDVMSTRAFYGDISIRGLNRPLNNQTLVLLNGRRVLNGPFDTAFWEGLPVVMTEIDRIEVVLGPASALYGANAISGVVNILTKMPTQDQEIEANYSLGERQTHLTNLSFGKRLRSMSLQIGAGFRQGKGFEQPDLLSLRVGKVHGQLVYQSVEGIQAKVSGGFANYRTQFSAGGVGIGFMEGSTRFFQANLKIGQSHIWGFWNRERPQLTGFQSAEMPSMASDSYSLNLEQMLLLTDRSSIMVGARYFQNTMRSHIYDPEEIIQHLWGLFFEGAWYPAPAWVLVASGRLDWHPITHWQASPRLSLVYSPVPQHVFRLSAGTAFRNPAITESHVAFKQMLETPFAFPVSLMIRGGNDLKAERMAQIEAAHTGMFGRLKTSLVGFHYRLKNLITPGHLMFDASQLPTLALSLVQSNTIATYRAWGGETTIEWQLHSHIETWANVSWQTLKHSDGQVSLNQPPAYKFNTGVRFQHGGLQVQTWLHGVDDKSWSDVSLENLTNQTVSIDGYVLVNGRVGYAFSNALKGLKLSVEGFNVLNNRHYELLPARGRTEPGQNGEIIGRRVTATAAYQF